MVNDPIGDMLIQIKNAAAAGKRLVELPASRVKLALARILVKEGYLTSVAVAGDKPKTLLRIGLKYTDKTSAIAGVKRISKPGLRFYVGSREIPTVVGGLGIAVISTPQGLMTGTEAKKSRLGGELLCEIW